MAWYILPLPRYHCQHYGMVLCTISTMYGMVALSTLWHGTTVNTMAWYHCQHYGMVPLSTLWYGTTVNTMAWYHYQYYGMVLCTISTMYGMVALSTPLSTL